MRRDNAAAVDPPADGKLAFLPKNGDPRSWLPRNGLPHSVVELLVQRLIRVLSFLPVYTAVIVTCIILIQVFGLPWGIGK